MTEREKQPLTELVYSTEKLRKLIVDNPDLPLLILAGENANEGEYYNQVCTGISADIGEFLDCHQKINEEYVFTDREDFEAEVWEKIEEERGGSAIDVKKQLLKQRMAEYAPYWKKCIILYVDNM